ncbi:GFA family protein [Neptunomonas sp.]|uniref:GFA family protein n=1 Tax=Neptunomonas sp. TaxID=1971898 RepID=UPI003566B1A6
MTIRGGCLCGEVTYEVTGNFLSAMNCHCSRCRRAHGAAFASYGEVKPGQFRWLTGESNVSTYGEGKGAYCFCSRCGSNLAATWEGEVLEVALGTLKDDPGITPGYHQHVESKAVWHDILDDKKQFGQGYLEPTDENA